MLVSELSEDELLSLFVPNLPSGPDQLLGPGDDCAVISAADGRFVTSTDMLVEDLDFRRLWSSGYEVGQRLAAQNLADCAAMGARPTSLLVCLGIPKNIEVSWVQDFTAGLALRCREADVGLSGGDLSGAPRVIASATVTGSLDGGDPVLRSGAQSGDQVALAGTLGKSAAGWALCEAGFYTTERLTNVPSELHQVATECLQIFKAAQPPLSAGVEARLAGATAMLDVSDGLLRDCQRVAKASAIGMNLQSFQLERFLRPLSQLANWLQCDVTDWILSGGEDHGLLATFPAEVVLPAVFEPIGICVSEHLASIMIDDILPNSHLGWDHFRAED